LVGVEMRAGLEFLIHLRPSLLEIARRSGFCSNFRKLTSIQLRNSFVAGLRHAGKTTAQGNRRRCCVLKSAKMSAVLSSISVPTSATEKAWVEKLKTHWTPLLAISLRVAPLARAAGWAYDIVAFHAIGEAVEGLHGGSHPALSPLADEVGTQEAPLPVDIRTREVLKDLIDHLDSKRPLGPSYGGLHPHIVEDGRLLWLCPDHLEAYRPK
jgi:hypothetical protein